MRKGIRFVTSFIAFLFLCVAVSFSQAVYQKAGRVKPNSQDGYDYYDDEGNKTGYSIPNRDGGYDYYDARGNPQGSLKKRTKTSYEFYNKEGAAEGTLTSSPGEKKTYRYKRRDKGSYKVTPAGQDGDIGEIPTEELLGK